MEIYILYQNLKELNDMSEFLGKAERTYIGSKHESRQVGRKMTSFRGSMAKLGAGVDHELGRSAPHQCR